MTFFCETCGEPVEVAVRRNHRYCAECKQERVRQMKNEWQRQKGQLRAAVRDENDWAELEVERLLGVSSLRVGRCRGCGGVLPAMRRHGNPRRWCSEACRVRVAGRGAFGAPGYAGALLRDPCSYCGAPSAELDHVVARSRGGDEGWSNLTGVCQICNIRKRDLGVLRFMLARPLFLEMDRIKGELAGLRVA